MEKSESTEAREDTEEFENGREGIMNDDVLNENEPRKKRAPLTVAQKIAEAQNFKAQGNTFFSQGLHSKAIRSYCRVFAYTNGLQVGSSLNQYQSALNIQPPNEEEQREIEQLQITSWSNMAICCLKLKKPRDALTHLAKIIDKEPAHSKALYNQGRAYMEIKDLDRAKASLTEAAKIAPQDVLITRQLNKLNKLYGKQNAQEKSLWESAFKKM